MDLPHDLSRTEPAATFLVLVVAAFMVLVTSVYLASSAAPQIERAMRGLTDHIVVVVARGAR